MNKKSIWIIIGLMSIALIGIIFIQLFWINWFVKLNEKNFDDRVYVALNRVRIQLADDVQSPIDIKGFRNNSSILTDEKSILDGKFGKALSKYDPFTQSKLLFELRSLSADFNPTELLFDLKPGILSSLVHTAILDQGIDLEFDYGVFSTESNDFFIVNENYVPVTGNMEESSSIGKNKSLYDTKYKVQLFTTEFENPGHLAVFFKNKRGFVWSAVIPWLIGSIIFTGLILFCFSYVIFVVFRQKKVSEMKTDFINNMTHEFKTPIATISLASDSIKSPKIIGSPEKINRFVEIIRQENKRMLNQVEKVLQMAQIEKQDFELNLDKLDIEEILHQVIENTNLKIQSREGELTYNIDLEDPTIIGDQTHISSILYNLIDNAEKYSPEILKIHINAKDTGQGVFISIKDHGLGMTSEEVKYIFDKFYRVHTGNLHNVKGFGLGLSYVKVMTEAHRGSISVESTPGKGSTFHLFLPRDPRR